MSAETAHCLGPPFVSLPHSLLGTHRKEPSTSHETNVLLRCRRFGYALCDLFLPKPLTATDAPFRRWKRGFNQSRFSLSLAHKTCGASQYISSCLTAFLICYFPPCLSTQGRSGVLGGHWLLPACPFGAIRRAPKRRTHERSIAHVHTNVK